MFLSILTLQELKLFMPIMAIPAPLTVFLPPILPLPPTIPPLAHILPKKPEEVPSPGGNLMKGWGQVPSILVPTN